MFNIDDVFSVDTSQPKTLFMFIGPYPIEFHFEERETGTILRKTVLIVEEHLSDDIINAYKRSAISPDLIGHFAAQCVVKYPIKCIIKIMHKKLKFTLELSKLESYDYYVTAFDAMADLAESVLEKLKNYLKTEK